MIIYEIIEKSTNKTLYVGKTTKYNNNEEFQKNNYWGSGKIIKSVIKKHGTDDLERKVLEQKIKTLKKLKEREEFWIKEKNTLYPNGYNLTDKSDGGDKFTNNPNKEKIRKRKKDFYQTQEGRKWRKEHSEKLKDFYQTSEGKKWREEQSGKKSHRWGKIGYWTGKKRPNHSKRFIGGKNPRAREVVLISPEGDKSELSYYKDFCLEHNIDPGAICRVLRGKRNHHKGWTGKYLDGN